MYKRQGKVLLNISISSLKRGETRSVTLDSIAIPVSNKKLYATLYDDSTDSNTTVNRLEITLFIENRLPIFFDLWPNRIPFLDGDPIIESQGILVSFPKLDGSQLDISIDGLLIEPDSTINIVSDRTHLLYRPKLIPGSHLLTASLSRSGTKLGSAEFSFYLDEVLTIRNDLVYPNPVKNLTNFTYFLSQDANVTTKIFTLSGATVKTLGPHKQSAGFQNIFWDSNRSIF